MARLLSRTVLLAVVLSGLLLLPIWVNPYFLFLANMVFVYIVLAVGLNLLLGYAGQFAFANVAFFGIGAYTTGLLQVKLGLSYWLTLPLSGLGTAAIGVVIGLPALRMSGLYLAIVTLAFTQLTQWVMIHWDRVTFGAGGFKSPAPSFGPFPWSSEQGVYYLSLVVCAFLLLVAWNVTRSKIGRAWVALRDSEVAAQALAIDLAYYKTLAFAMSAFYAGIAGALHAAALRFVSPEGYDLLQTVIHFAMVVIGGLASITGSVCGAMLVYALQEMLRSVESLQEILFGLLLMLCIVFLPEGLFSLVKYRFEGWKERLRRADRGSPVVDAERMRMASNGRA
jgi:branched-chain amino acid transport system permease protein